jgi:hypothetical protein
VVVACDLVGNAPSWATAVERSQMNIGLQSTYLSPHMTHGIQTSAKIMVVFLKELSRDLPLPSFFTQLINISAKLLHTNGEQKFYTSGNRAYLSDVRGKPCSLNVGTNLTQ